MSGAIPLLPHYAFMAWCSVKAGGQLYLFTTPRRRTGEWMYSSTHSLTSVLMEVNDQLHAPAALPPGKQPLVRIG
jgi:hypothetical protein